MIWLSEALRDVNTRNKIVSLTTLQGLLPRLRRKGFATVFTNGCFDILHYGHIKYLERVKRNNRILIVGINSDASVRQIKGPSRPVVPLKQRAAIVAALACVDFVIVFSEKTPYRVIKALKPDILVKGADWKEKGAVGSDIVKGRGGKTEFIPYVKGFSTTQLIASIRKTCAR